MPDQPAEEPPRPAYFPPGSIGDLCCRVGYDVRDLILDGYTWDEIHDVAYRRVTLEELLRRGPASRRPK